MQIKPKVGILTTFSGSDEAYSLVVVVKTQLQMLIEADYYPVLYVCSPFTGTGVWMDKHVEIRRTVNGDADHVDICTELRKTIGDIDVMICHDIVFLSQHAEWAKAVRILAREFPHIRWLHWQHSRGDHAAIEPVPNSEFCYPNNGDLQHVAEINSTTMDRVFYVPHPLDFNYLGWNELAIRIAEDYGFPFADVSMIYPTRLDRQKQVEKAMRVFAGFKKAGKSICLLVADAYATGDRFKEYKKDCMKLAEELGLTNKEFAFLGEVYEECTLGTPRQTVKALFEMSSIFLQVSTSETSSLVAMEACMAGNMLVLNADFKPIHHLYGKAITLDFGSIFSNTQYFRNVPTADGGMIKVEDAQLYFDDRARDFILPILSSQMTIALKRQQLRERWPSRVMKDYLEPLLLKDWNPEEKKIKCEGDPEVTAIICSLDNLEILKRQVPVLMKECGKIIVVNNGSRDGTKEWLEETPIEGLSIINMPKNDGASKGRNAGLALWDTQPTPYTLMVDGGILPCYNGVRAMKNYLIRHPEVLSISPEIATCYTTNEEEATLVFGKDDIDDADTFFQKDLSGTAYCLARAEAWMVRFNEDGPYGEPGWGVDDNDMAYRWRERDMLHTDFMSGEGMILFRRASGSFQRLFEETGVWPNQYGSNYEKRLVKLRQDYPQYQNFVPEISIVVLGWNEYPMIQKVVKVLHDEFYDKVGHEIIVINNGSTDETQKWIDERRYRQHHGDCYIDLDGNIIRRSAENEEYWTGNFIPYTFERNSGTGAGFNKGFEMARGKFIFYICGDMLPVKGSVMGLYQWLLDHPDEMYAGVNAWMNVRTPEEATEFNGYFRPMGLGNYAYSYAMVRREVWDNGVRFADQGPFEGAGAGFEEAEFANLLFSKGYHACLFNEIAYYHQRRDGTRSGLEERTDGAGVDERKKYLLTRWNDIGFDITHHHHEQPPERHYRRIAMMNNLYEGNPGPAGFLAMALRKIGCIVKQFNSLDNPYQATDKRDKYEDGYFDNFIFVDDGDLQHWTCPEWGHPSIFWAIDMYNPTCFPYAPPEAYLEKGKTFDRFCSISKSAVDYCNENGLPAFHLPHAANEDYHKHWEMDKIYDWVAVWSNYGDREAYSKAAQDKFPGGLLTSGLWGDEYPKTVSQGKCAISMARGYEYPARVVETMLIGTPLVSRRDRFIDMFFVENEHFRGFSTVEEMLDQIQWVVDHPEESLEMADKAHKLVYSQHRYYHRALRMFGW